MISRFCKEYKFLSNFFPSPIVEEGVNYPTVEHAYQAMKNLDNEYRVKVADCGYPGNAKKLGRKVLLRSNWEEIKNSIMAGLIRRKFLDPDLRRKLLATVGHILVEGNWWHDQYWGNCLCSRCRNIPGLNYLGKILMTIRDDQS